MEHVQRIYDELGRGRKQRNNQFIPRIWKQNCITEKGEWNKVLPEFCESDPVKTLLKEWVVQTYAN